MYFSFSFPHPLSQTSDCSTLFSFSEKELAFFLSLGFPEAERMTEICVHVVNFKITVRGEKHEKCRKTKVGLHGRVPCYGDVRLDPAYEPLRIVHPIMEQESSFLWFSADVG